MITWRDEAILIRARPHGESAAIISVLCPSHGRAKGVVRGGAGKRMAPILQPGAQLDVTWRARLPEHLGHFTVELTRSRAHQALSSRLALAGVNALCAMLDFAVPEGEADAPLYARSFELCELLGQDALWPLAYLRWEQALLEGAGYGLSLEVCGVTGAQTDLRFISPRSGAAISAGAAGKWAPRLLPLAPALVGRAQGPAAVADALDVLRHFWHHKLAAALGHPVPQARARLIEAIKLCE